MEDINIFYGSICLLAIIAILYRCVISPILAKGDQLVEQEDTADIDLSWLEDNNKTTFDLLSFIKRSDKELTDNDRVRIQRLQDAYFANYITADYISRKGLLTNSYKEVGSDD